MSTGFEVSKIAEASPLRTGFNTTKRFLGRMALIFGLTAASGAAVVAGEAFLTPGVAEAAGFANDYPDMDATDCSTQYGIYSWCKGGTYLSPRRYAYRNCTDGAAYWTKKYTGVDVRGWGHAYNWDNAAPQSKVLAGSTNSIEPGDIAQSDDGKYGHVGFVTDVTKSSSGKVTGIRVAELNKAGTGNYTHTWYTSKNSSGKFIRSSTRDWDHFIDVNGLGKGLNNQALGSTALAYKRGDFNRDGKADIAWYENWKTAISLLQSTGSSYKILPLKNNIGTPDWAGVGDFDGNKLADIAWYEKWKNSLTVLVNHGGGVYSLETFMTDVGSPTWAGVGDFDGDGRDDVAWYEQWQNKLTILRSTGGSFRWWAAKTGIGGPTWAGVGYFNGDRKADVVWHENWKNALTVFTHDGAQSFNARQWKSGIGGPTWAGVGDFDGNGRDDIAWFEQWKNAVTLLHNNGASGFDYWPGKTGIGKPDWAGVGDFNGDGKDDIAWYEAWQTAITVLKGNGSSGLAAQKWLTGISKPTWANGRNGSFPSTNGK